MNLLDGMKLKNTIINTKGSEYYATSYDANLDVFTMMSRYYEDDKIINMFNLALDENEDLALANLLYILDIRKGKGERKIFKTIFKNLCRTNSKLALKVLPFIGDLGRYDYILEGIGTPIESDVVTLIKEQLKLDKKSDSPSLLAKWLPTLRTHNKNNVLAKKLVKLLKIDERTYRKMLSSLRGKLNIVEKNLTNKEYDKINFEEIPTKAMLKYSMAYNVRMPEKYQKYKDDLKEGKAKINVSGLFAYEIIKKVIDCSNDEQLLDLMWKNQKDLLDGCETDVLVMADTSGSMTLYEAIPYATSVGLALYTAERNNGYFKNHFITFSENPMLCEVKGQTIKEKIGNIKSIVASTNIDKAFKLLLDTAIENEIPQKELPSHLIIISDMEFDRGVYSNSGTNFNGWKEAFKKAGYQLPIIIFWNVCGYTKGTPVTKFDNDVCMVSGFSTNILENLLTLDNYSPINVMLDKLGIYLEMIKRSN